jgi:hypothetical protein
LVSQIVAIVGPLSGRHLWRVIVNSRQFAQVGLGLIGVWALVSALTLFSRIVSIGDAGPRGRDILVVAVPLALLVGFSYLLVFRSTLLAATIAPDVAVTNERGTQDLARVLVALVGVFLLAQALPITLNVVLAFFAAGEFPEAPSRAPQIRSFIGVCVQDAVALYLIMRPGRLVEYVRRPLPERAG